MNKDRWAGLTAALAVVLAYAVMELAGITCPIRYVTGISCAGCGMSRAWISLLSGHVERAFFYHPCFMLPPLALILWLVRGKLPEKAVRAVFGLIIACFLVVYVIRLLDPGCPIVTAEPANSCLVRMIVRPL